MRACKSALVFLAILISITFASAHAENNSASRSGSNGKIKPAASYGQVNVKTWADGRKAAFSFSFDDALMSQYQYVRPIMNSFGFHATYYVISSALVDNPPAIWRYGLWSQFQQLYQEGNEIGDHTVTHPDLTTLPVGDINTPNTITYELYQSKQVIEQKIPGLNIITMAYPYCTHNATVDSVAAEFYQAARSCGSYTNPADVTGNAWYGLAASDVQFDQPRNTLSDDQDEFDMYTNIVDNRDIAYGRWSIFLAHEVVPFSQISSGAANGLYYPVSTEWLTQLCQWVKQKSDEDSLWVETVGNVTRYIKEREHFTYALLSSTADQIQIYPADGLDDNIFNYPLTVDVTVPPDWKNVSVQQGNRTEEVSTFSDGSGTYARIHVVPDAGTVTINNDQSGFSLSGIVTYDNPAQTPLQNVTVKLISGTDTLTTATDASGSYSFGNLTAGTYTVEASKSGQWGGVNSTDALETVRYFSHISSLTSLQMKAADVNNNGEVNSTDALMIVRRFLKLVNSFAVPDWIFNTPPSVTVTNADVVLNIKGIAAGDVNTSYTPQ